MRLEHLLAFEAIKRYRNFSLAAENRYVSQSALSKQLKSLEDTLGVVLFDRNQPSLPLTPAGKRISPHIETILKEFERMVIEAKDYVKERKLRIASFCEMAQYGITDLFVAFEHDKPHFHIESKECNHSQMLDLLQNRQTDLIIGYQEFLKKNDDHCVIPLLQDDLILIVNETHPLARKRIISLVNLDNEQFCFPREDDSLFDFFFRTCECAGFLPKHTLSNVRLGTIKRYIAKGMRVTLQTRSRALNFFHEPTFRLINLEESPTLTLSIVANKDLLPPIANDFITFARLFYDSALGSMEIEMTALNNSK